MNDLDNEIRDYYADQELDSGLLDSLLQMEADAEVPEPGVPVPANRPRKGLWMGLGAVAAAALIVVTVGTVATTALTATYSAAPNDQTVERPTNKVVAGVEVTIDSTTTPHGNDGVADLPHQQPLPGAKDDRKPQLLIIRGNKVGDVGSDVYDASGNQAPEVRDPWSAAADSPATGQEQGLLGKRLQNVSSGLDGQQVAGGATAADPTMADPVALEALGYIDAANDLDGRFARLHDGEGEDIDANRYRNRGPGPRGLALGWVPAHTLTTVDALSTFSVDVDTGAWTRSRRALSEGYLPQAHEVRPEEFVNAFRYDYEAPASGPFAASSEIVPSPFDSERHLVRVGLQGKRISVFERKPVHLTFLIDVSGSMSGPDRLPLAKRGLKKLVGELKDGDTVALVTYSGNTRIALEPTSVTDRQRILRGIDDISSSGGTAMGAGIDLAYGLAEQTLEPGAINRVVLASDGDANVGETNAQRLAQKLRAAADKGITLTTLGFGTGNYRDDVMEQLADKGDGHYHYIANDRDAEKVLVDGLTGTLQTIARDVKIQVEFDPGVVSEWRQIGYDNRQIADRDFRNDSVDAGEVGAGHQVTALYEVKLVDPTDTAVLGDLRLRYEAPGAEGAPAVERQLKLLGTPRETLREASADTRLAVVAGTFAERLRMRPGPSLASLLDLLPERPEYAEDDAELRQAIQNAQRLGL